MNNTSITQNQTSFTARLPLKQRKQLRAGIQRWSNEISKPEKKTERATIDYSWGNSVSPKTTSLASFLKEQLNLQKVTLLEIGRQVEIKVFMPMKGGIREVNRFSEDLKQIQFSRVLNRITQNGARH